FLFFLWLLPPPRSTLFPYTTLFRSSDDVGLGHGYLEARERVDDFWTSGVCDPDSEVHLARGGARAVPAVGSAGGVALHQLPGGEDRKSTRLNSSHVSISYAVFCLKK